MSRKWPSQQPAYGCLLCELMQSPSTWSWRETCLQRRSVLLLRGMAGFYIAGRYYQDCSCWIKIKNSSQAVDVLSHAPGVSLINDRHANRFPTPLDASNEDNVYVGRIRRDISRSDQRGLDLFVCGDQIKKGAALNAVQIAELLL